MGGLTVADTGPLVAALNRNERLHDLAARVVAALGTNLLVPLTVVAEVDHLVRTRVSQSAARAFLDAVDRGEHRIASIGTSVFRRAVDIDGRYADLGLGITDAFVMALAEKEQLPVLTFDLRHFRATASRQGPWRLVLGEDQIRTGRFKP